MKQGATAEATALESAPRFNIKTVFPGMSYLQHGDPYTGKTVSLYWDGHVVKSMQPIWLSDTRRWNLQILIFKWVAVTSFNDIVSG